MMKLNGNRRRADNIAEERQAYTTTANAPKPKRTGLKIALITGLAVAALVTGGAAAGVAYVNRIDTIFPNVTVDGLDISGLTLSETVEKLARNGYSNLAGKSVSVELPTDYLLTVSAEEVCSETPVTDIALMAWDACKGGSALEDALTYWRCRMDGMELESGAAMTVDETAVLAAVENAAGEVNLALLDSDLTIGETYISVLKGAQGVDMDTHALADMIVKAFREGNYTRLTYAAEIRPSTELDLDTLYDTICADSVNAAYDPATGQITPESSGLTFDLEEAQQLWDNASYGDRVYIPLEVIEPTITASQLQSLLFRDKLSSMSTSLAGSSANRINNVRKAASSINGVVLQPGAEFSYNPTLGQRTAENGYKLAGAYANGQTVQEYGGGICQVSSTLYYCALYANLKITSRTCHYFPVSYLPAGLDATVSWGGPEFKFVNNRDYPIKIVASVDSSGSNVSVEIWGSDIDGSYVEMTYNTWYTTNNGVQTGYQTQTYRSVFDKNGTLLSKTPEALSTYHYHSAEGTTSSGGTTTPVENNPTVVETPEIVDPQPQEPTVPTEPETPSVTEPAQPETPTEETPNPPETPPVEQPTYDPPVEQPTYDPPAEQPTYEPPAEQQPTYEPPVEQPTYEPPVEQPTYDPPAEQPSWGEPVWVPPDIPDYGDFGI